MIDDEARRRVEGYIEKGRNGSAIGVGGQYRRAGRREGCFVGPHIFAEVPVTASIAREEIFGPVLSVMMAATLDDAFSIFNDSQYALTGGFYSRSPENIARARRELRVGNLYINRKITGALVDRQPFGGFKLSGGGRKREEATTSSISCSPGPSQKTPSGTASHQSKPESDGVPPSATRRSPPAWGELVVLYEAGEVVRRA